MSAKITNNAWGVLASDITPTTLNIPLTMGDTSRFPTLTSGDYAWGTLSNASNQLEVVKITAISGNTVVVVRGQDGTTARGYLTGDRLDLRIPAALLNGKLDADVAAQTYAVKDGPTINNVSLTGTPTAVTPPAGSNDTRVATTAFVNAVATAASLPAQTGNAGKFMTTDGNTASWAQVYPPVSGNVNKVLSNNGTSTTWVNPNSFSEQIQGLMASTTIQWDLSAGGVADVTLTGDKTIGAPTNMAVRTYVMILRQDATGNRKATWNSVFKWAGATPPPLSTAPNAVDIFTFFCDGTSMYGGYLRGVG